MGFNKTQGFLHQKGHVKNLRLAKPSPPHFHFRFGSAVLVAFLVTIVCCLSL